MKQDPDLNQRIADAFKAGKPIDDAFLRAVRKAVPAPKRRKRTKKSAKLAARK